MKESRLERPIKKTKIALSTETDGKVNFVEINLNELKIKIKGLVEQVDSSSKVFQLSLNKTQIDYFNFIDKSVKALKQVLLMQFFLIDLKVKMKSFLFISL